MAFAGALLAGAPSFAQELSGEIAKRIESTFDLVIGNSPNLAIPLTRRALARRADEDKGVAPLPYRDTADPDPESTDYTVGSVEMADEGSADDPEIARLPRPRPDGEAAAASATGGAEAAPLDLVAGAPMPDLVAAAAPQVLVPPPPPHFAMASLQAPVAPPPPDQPILPPTSSAPTRELVASGDCLSPQDVDDKDGDFKRNADVLSSSVFCISEETFKERRRQWVVETIRTSRPGPLWAVMHDDEDMSFDNAVEALKTYGGTLVSVDTGGRRNMDGIDPNRNFSGDGIGCSKLGKDSAPHYTKFIHGLLSDQPIIALHNNVGGPVATGGLGHASMDSVPKDMQAAPAADPKSPLGGDRNLVLLVSPIPVTATSESRAAALAAKGINAMIEKVKDGGDCSLSNFALLTGHNDYLNVTVDHDKRDLQRQLIDVIMAGRNDTVATQ